MKNEELNYELPAYRQAGEFELGKMNDLEIPDYNSLRNLASSRLCGEEK
jgi:hypothetical protein